MATEMIDISGHTAARLKNWITEFEAQDVFAAETMAGAIRKARRGEHRHAEGDN